MPGWFKKSHYVGRARDHLGDAFLNVNPLRLTWRIPNIHKHCLHSPSGIKRLSIILLVSDLSTFITVRMCFGNKLKGEDPSSRLNGNSEPNSRPIDRKDTGQGTRSIKIPDEYAPPPGPPPSHAEYAASSGPPPGTFSFPGLCSNTHPKPSPRFWIFYQFHHTDTNINQATMNTVLPLGLPQATTTGKPLSQTPLFFPLLHPSATNKAGPTMRPKLKQSKARHGVHRTRSLNPQPIPKLRSKPSLAVISEL